MSFWDILNFLSPGLQTSMSPLPVQCIYMDERFQMDAHKPENVLLPSHLTSLYSDHLGHNHHFPLASPFASSWASLKYLSLQQPEQPFESEHAPMLSEVCSQLPSSLIQPKCHCTMTYVAYMNGSMIISSSSLHSTLLHSISYCWIFVFWVHTDEQLLQRLVFSLYSFRRF